MTSACTLKSYADCLMTSGAIQNGVPTNVFLLICVSVNWPATPKSASLTSPCSDSNTLAAVGKGRVINVGTLHQTKQRFTVGFAH